MRAVLVGVIVSALATSVAAQPSGGGRAKELYVAAEAAMAEQRFDDAIRDYGAAYELSKQPTLFYKIGAANEKAGKCPTAIAYYRRYLREGKPPEKFVALTRERITACGGDPDETTEKVAPPPPPPPPPPLPLPKVELTTPAPSPAPAPGLVHTRHGSRGAWLLVGGAITFATIGAVLAYAADSSEADLSDLYTGLGGRTPTFDNFTQTRYDDLVAQGERYQHLSWAAFGVAGVSAIGAAIVFAVGHGETIVTPTASATSAGVSTTFRF
ncbi:MAG: hypothetical protein NT062_01735 [Proteobacteria bacterium]|nr:hypothetical protein [Pseudomonadota bacterium]